MFNNVGYLLSEQDVTGLFFQFFQLMNSSAPHFAIKHPSSDLPTRRDKPGGWGDEYWRAESITPPAPTPPSSRST